jgi:hypothetical protein
VVTGAVSSDSVKWLRFFSPNTSQLLSTIDTESVDPREAGSFYLGSWALVHYLLDERPQEFAHFQRALGRLLPWRAAWEQSFPGLTPEALGPELVAYLEAGRFQTSRSHFAPPRFTPTVRELAEAEVHGARALLASTSGQAVAEAEVAAALALDPGELTALTVRFHSRLGRARGSRASIARRAVTAHPRDARAWLLAALAAPEVEERRRALATAEGLDPDHPGVIGLLAEDALARNDAPAALVHVRHAQRRSGVTPRNLALQFAALAASNRCRDAAALLERTVFEPACQISVSAGRPEVTCSDYVRRAYVASSCASPAL